MKCVCGYTNGTEWVGEDLIEVKGKLGEFLKVMGSFTRKHDYGIVEVSLYACPKCNTIQVKT